MPFIHSFKVGERGIAAELLKLHKQMATVDDAYSCRALICHAQLLSVTKVKGALYIMKNNESLYINL